MPAAPVAAEPASTPLPPAAGARPPAASHGHGRRRSRPPSARPRPPRPLDGPTRRPRRRRAAAPRRRRRPVRRSWSRRSSPRGFASKTDTGNAVEETLPGGSGAASGARTRRFVLTVGNAGGLELTLNGQRLPPLGAPRRRDPRPRPALRPRRRPDRELLPRPRRPRQAGPDAIPSAPRRRTSPTLLVDRAARSTTRCSRSSRRCWSRPISARPPPSAFVSRVRDEAKRGPRHVRRGRARRCCGAFLEETLTPGRRAARPLRPAVGDPHARRQRLGQDHDAAASSPPRSRPPGKSVRPRRRRHLPRRRHRAAPGLGPPRRRRGDPPGGRAPIPRRWCSTR